VRLTRSLPARKNCVSLCWGIWGHRCWMIFHNKVVRLHRLCIWPLSPEFHYTAVESCRALCIGSTPYMPELLLPAFATQWPGTAARAVFILSKPVRMKTIFYRRIFLRRKLLMFRAFRRLLPTFLALHAMSTQIWALFWPCIYFSFLVILLFF